MIHVNTYEGVTCPKNNHIQWYECTRLELDTIFSNGLDSVPFETNVWSIQAFEIFGIYNNSLASGC